MHKASAHLRADIHFALHQDERKFSAHPRVCRARNVPPRVAQHGADARGDHGLTEATRRIDKTHERQVARKTTSFGLGKVLLQSR